MENFMINFDARRDEDVAKKVDLQAMTTEL